MRRILLTAGLVAAAVAPSAAAAAVGAPLASGLGEPRGLTTDRGGLWAADADRGVCRLVVRLSRGRADRSGCTNDGAGGGQTTVLRTVTGAHVFVASPASDGGVIRYRLVRGRLTAPVVIGDELLAGLAPTAVAVGGDGAVYVGVRDDDRIVRIVAADTDEPVVEEIARTAGGGTRGLAMVGDDLYVAAPFGIRLVAGASVCEAVAPCGGQVTDIHSAAPRTIATDGKGRLAIGESGRVLLHDLGTARTVILGDSVAAGGGRLEPLGLVRAVAFSGGRVIAGVDGARGRFGGLAAFDPADGPGVGDDPAPEGDAEASSVASAARSLGIVRVGADWWVARRDGLCRAGATPTCVRLAKVNGQPAVAGSLVLVPTERGLVRVDVSRPVPVAWRLGSGAAARRTATAVALDPVRGTVVAAIGGLVMRVDVTANGGAGALEPIGRQRAGGGIRGLALRDDELVIAERHGLTRIHRLARCSSTRPCRAVGTGLDVRAPTAIAWRGADLVVTERRRVLVFRGASSPGALLAAWGVSASGLRALEDLVGVVPTDTGVAVVDRAFGVWDVHFG